MAFVLAPEPPLADWLAELDGQIARSAGFFVGRPVVLDLAGLALTRSDVVSLIADLQGRDIRIMGVEGVDPDCLGPGLPPLLRGGRPAAGIIETLDPATESPSTVPLVAPSKAAPAFLLLDSPVRSGQSVVFPDGDVTVVGSVASGAEVVAGGSIHIYGTLRGRAIAGSTGNQRARIFCRKSEAELLAIDGWYRTADDMNDTLYGRPIQAWLENDAIMVAALDQTSVGG
jgi:septum site-determining protein MinC